MFFLTFNVCRLCFQRVVLISAIFAGFGRKPENASVVQIMPSTNAKRPATFVLFQQVNYYQHEKLKKQNKTKLKKHSKVQFSPGKEGFFL